MIAHRGAHLDRPENTIPAYRSAVEMGVDFIEIDIRRTKDGRLVLMHDRTVDRTTNETGQLASMTFDQVRALDASKGFPAYRGTRVPTLDEAMDVVQGTRTGIYLDCKDVGARELVDAIERHKLSEQVVIYAGRELLTQILALRPALKAMPEASNPAVLKDMIDKLHLRVAAFDARDFNDETIAVAKSANVEIYVDRLGQADTQTAWQESIDRGASGIQTNKPAELIEYLRSKGLHQ